MLRNWYVPRDKDCSVFFLIVLLNLSIRLISTYCTISFGFGNIDKPLIFTPPRVPRHVPF